MDTPPLLVRHKKEIKEIKALTVASHDRQCSLEAALAQTKAERDALKNENDGHKAIISTLTASAESATKRIAALTDENEAVRKDRNEIAAQLAKVISEQTVAPATDEEICRVTPDLGGSVPA